MIWGGSPANIIKAAEKGRISIIASEQIVREINQTLAYPRLREIYEGAGIGRDELIEAVLRVAKMVEVTKKIELIQEDPADNKFLECALDGKADYIVSGDSHLLRIGQYQRIQIHTVRQFTKLMKES
jgi:putative PIN family toxin of toxin-antitoxin system